jgi:hypothetical protein
MNYSRRQSRPELLSNRAAGAEGEVRRLHSLIGFRKITGVSIMRTSHVFGVSTAVVFILSIAWFAREPATAQKKPAQNLQKWEYKVKTVHPLNLDRGGGEMFNKLGSEGWELCATERNNKKDDNQVVFVIFKRPKR